MSSFALSSIRGMVDGVALMDVTMNDPRIELAQFSSIPLISIGHPMNEINVHALIPILLKWVK